MNILTNDEINELSHPAARGKSVNACIMAAEKLIFEKLAGMELPEPNCYRADCFDRELYVCEAQAVLDALRQAFAQGAARQLSAIRTLEHLGYTNCGGEYWKPPLGKK